MGARDDPVERARDQVVRRRGRRCRPGARPARRPDRAAPGRAAKTAGSHRTTRCRRDGRCDRVERRILPADRDHRRRRAAHLQGAGERAQGTQGARGGRHRPRRRPLGTREGGGTRRAFAVDTRQVQRAGLQGRRRRRRRGDHAGEGRLHRRTRGGRRRGRRAGGRDEMAPVRGRWRRRRRGLRGGGEVELEVRGRGGVVRSPGRDRREPHAVPRVGRGIAREAGGCRARRRGVSTAGRGRR